MHCHSNGRFSGGVTSTIAAACSAQKRAYLSTVGAGHSLRKCLLVGTLVVLSPFLAANGASQTGTALLRMTQRLFLGSRCRGIFHPPRRCVSTLEPARGGQPISRASGL